MKNKLLITLLALTMTAAMLAGCGKETAEVQSADTETVVEVNTETKAVVVETETEESTEGAELVYNTETDTEVVAKGDKSDKADSKSDSKTDSTSTKDSASKTDSKDAGTKTDTKTETKADTKTDSATQAPAETTTNTPAQTPAETPAPEPEPEAPAQNLCPYTVNTWMDMGDGWWGCYKAYIPGKSYQENTSTYNELSNQFENKLISENLTYDNSGSEVFGDYDDAKNVQLVKYHLVPAPEGAYDPQD